MKGFELADVVAFLGLGVDVSGEVGVALRTAGIAHFARPGPLGIVRPTALRVVRPMALRVVRPGALSAEHLLDKVA